MVSPVCRTVPDERLLGRGEGLLGGAERGHRDHLLHSGAGAEPGKGMADLGARLGLAEEAGQVKVPTTDRYGNRTLL